MGMVGYFVPTGEIGSIKSESDIFTLSENAEEFNVDKSWQLLWFLYQKIDNEKASLCIPLDEKFALPFEIEYGMPPFYLDCESVKAGLEFLEGISKERINALIDIDECCNEYIYPVYPGDSVEELTDYCWIHHEKLIEFYKKVINDSKGVVFYVM